MPIDYSKWDKTDASDSEDEGQALPRVTRLEEATTVTRTPDGTIHLASQQAPATKDNADSKPSSTKASWTVKGGSYTDESGQLVYWTQNRTTCTLRILLSNTKKIECSVTNALSYADRMSAIMNSIDQELLVRRDQEILLRDALAYPVHLEQDEDTIDWTIERHDNEPILVINLFKATPVTDVTIWWRHPLKRAPQIEIETSKQTQDFQTAWEQAHKEFRKR